MSDRLQEGIAAARAGRRAEARGLLMQVVDVDERNETAWMWLAGVLDDPEEMRVCLENVLELNPSNSRAQEGLAWVDERYGPRTTVTEPAPLEISVGQAAVQPTPVPEQQLAEKPSTPATVQPATPPEIKDTPLPTKSPQYRSLHELPLGTDPARLGDTPCPYCGVPTWLNQQSCPSCRKSLMTRRPPEPDKRSKALIFLAIGWLFPIGIGLLAALGRLIVGLGMIGSPLGRIFIVSSIIGLVIYILISIPFLLLARGLFRSRPWAYITQVVLNTIQLGIFILLAFLLAKQLREAPLTPDPFMLSSNSLATLFLWAVIIVNIAWCMIVFLLLWFGHSTVYGKLGRFVPTIEVSPHSYNNGLSYQKRGMSYMAVQEWEGAVLHAPNDLQALHALGLGYLQIGQFERARQQLDRALKIAPNNPQLQESRALVDTMAGQASQA